MIERRPILDMISHLVLILGVLIVAFPIYVAFVASTQTVEQSSMSPISLVPGDQFIQNYSQVLGTGTTRVAVAPVARMMWVSLVSALAIAIG